MRTIITNAKVVDGTGNPWRYGDILIHDDTIQNIRPKLNVLADRVVDAGGLVVAPGFVEVQSHTDGTFIFRPEMHNCVTTGVTSSVFGKCGESVFPDKQNWLDFLSRYYYRRGFGYPTPKEFEAARADWNASIGRLWASSYFYIKEFEESAADWHSLREYCDLLLAGRPAVNAVPLIGLTTIEWKTGIQHIDRVNTRSISSADKDAIKALVRQGLDEGAVGLSVMRDQGPDVLLSTKDHIDIAQIVADHGRVLHFHARGIATHEGLTEAFAIARKTGVKIHLAHLNVAPFWEKGSGNELSMLLGMVDAAREEGLDITFDVTQKRDHCFGADSLLHNFRIWCQRYADAPPDGMDTLEEFRQSLRDPAYRDVVRNTVMGCVGRVSGYFRSLFTSHLDTAILARTDDPAYEGKTLGDVAEVLRITPDRLFFDIGFGISPLVQHSPGLVLDFPFGGHPGSVNIVRSTNHPAAVPVSDVSVESVPPDHYFTLAPYTTMPYYFRRALEHGVRLEDAIRKMSSLPASTVGLSDRGLLQAGMKADLVILDPLEFNSTADAAHPWSPPRGLSHVMVNGTFVLDGGNVTDERPGRVLLQSS